MNTYLDVGVQRIGEYLTRVPRLKQLRGASAAITRATDWSDSRWNELRDVKASLNGEAGQADGVLHLKVTAGQDPAAVADQVLAVLRGALPGAQLAATWHQASDYPTAFTAMHSEPDGHRLWLPSTNELPVARPCGNRGGDDRGCGQRPGGSTGEAALCPDCRARANNPDSEESGDVGRAETLLAEVGKPVWEIQKLCPSGTKPPVSNHVATIAIDGNGVGGYFARLIQAGDTEKLKGASVALKDATQEAFQEAAYAISSGGSAGVIPVVLGGDDVIAIVAAINAWDFVLSFQKLFEEKVAQRLGADDTNISASAGIVFHHIKSPVTQNVAMADELMRRAKGLHRGAAAAVCWVDTTVDGLEEEGALSRRPAVLTQDLRAASGDLAELSKLAQSARGNLRREAEELLSLAVTDEDRREYMAYRASRIGADAVVGRFPYPRSEAGKVDLSVALDLAEWWPSPAAGGQR